MADNVPDVPKATPDAKTPADATADSGSTLGGLANRGASFMKNLPNRVPGGWGTLGGMGAGALLGYLLKRDRDSGLGSALMGAGLGGAGGYAAQQLPWQRWLGQNAASGDEG